MLVRASLGMAITMSLIGFSTNIWQSVGLRLLAGIAGGYSSGSTIFIAVQTPKARSGWALGMLGTSVLLLLGAIFNWRAVGLSRRPTVPVTTVS
jgi:nitrate/nitrite transporter NarK